MSIKRKAPRDQRAANKVEEGDIAVLDRQSDQNTPGLQNASGWRPRRIERRDWRGEGVVSLNHTD
jgi:hypothetical protein